MVILLNSLQYCLLKIAHLHISLYHTRYAYVIYQREICVVIFIRQVNKPLYINIFACGIHTRVMAMKWAVYLPCPSHIWNSAKKGQVLMSAVTRCPQTCQCHLISFLAGIGMANWMGHLNFSRQRAKQNRNMFC